MARQVITDEAMFWSLVECGADVYAVNSKQWPSPLNLDKLLEARGRGARWLEVFRQEFLPNGEYHVEVE